MTVSEEQRQAEMSRGAAVADKARRASDLERLNSCGKVAIQLEPRTGIHEIYGHIAHFIVDRIEVCSEDTRDPEYPSDRVLATINLAIEATVGFDGVPGPKPTHEVSAEGRHYNERLAAMNKHRWGAD